MSDIFFNATVKFLSQQESIIAARISIAMREALLESEMVQASRDALAALIQGARPQDQQVIDALTAAIIDIEQSIVALPLQLAAVMDAIREAYGDQVADVILESFEGA